MAVEVSVGDDVRSELDDLDAEAAIAAIRAVRGEATDKAMSGFKSVSISRIAY